MSVQQTIACVIGTRPEVIKMAPVIHALREYDWVRCIVIVTAQHRDLLDQMLARFDVVVDHDLDLMKPRQHPSQLVARMLPALESLFMQVRAGIVLAQGDTTTAFVAALAAFHARIPFGHVEAGLRTYDLAQPFPEEGNRQMISRIAHWNFAPTQGAADALRSEGIASDSIYVTGNTSIDALMQTLTRLGPVQRTTTQRLLLLTVHRRENFGEPLCNVFRAIRRVVEAYPDVEVVYPVHPNPNIQSAVTKLLRDRPRIHCVLPMDYFEFVDAMRRATIILTDSGGIQEEAPALAKPVLVLRNRTERPEAIDEGVARLVGTTTETIVTSVTTLLDQPDEYARMATGVSPFGDGHAATRILAVLAKAVAS